MVRRNSQTQVSQSTHKSLALQRRLQCLPRSVWAGRFAKRNERKGTPAGVNGNRVLILDRRKGEKILIGDNIVLTLIRQQDGVAFFDILVRSGACSASVYPALRSRETWRINNDVVFTVTKIVDEWVSIGVSAPRSIPIHREEVNKRILRESSGGGREPCGSRDAEHTSCAD